MLSVSEVTFRHPGRSRPTLDQVTLRVDRGEALGLVGASGAGKSTLLRVISGLERHQAGSIQIDGATVDRLPPHRRGIAMMQQTPALMPHLSVEGNLVFALNRTGLAPSTRASRIAEILEVLGIGHLADRKPHALSGGEAQRVALGRAWIRRPAVLLLDEPFGQLDPPRRATLAEVLRNQQRRFSTTTLFVSHDWADLARAVDRIAVLSEQGRLLQIDRYAALRDHPRHIEVARLCGPDRWILLSGHLASDALEIREDSGRPIGRVPIRSETDLRILQSEIPTQAGNGSDCWIGIPAWTAQVVPIDASRVSDAELGPSSSEPVGRTDETLELIGGPVRPHSRQCDSGWYGLIEFAGTTLSARFPGLDEPQGDRVAIRIPWSALRVFDRATGWGLGRSSPG